MLEVHLMIERPERHVRDFVKAGADSVTFHAEATPHLAYAANCVRERARAWALRSTPRRPPGALAELADTMDLALCMTVNPGWGGQPFIEHSLEKLPRAARAGRRGRWRSRWTAASTRRRRRAAGRPERALFVAGSAIFGAPDPAEAYRGRSLAAGLRAAAPTWPARGAARPSRRQRRRATVEHAQEPAPAAAVAPA